MTSQKQLQANRLNARKSTGPKTDAGKALARLNSLRHGLTAGQVVVIPGEDELLFYKLYSELMMEYDPETALQEELVKQLAGILWRLRRVPVFEAAIFNACYGEVAKLKWPHVENAEYWPLRHSVHTGLALMEDAKTADALGKLTRYNAGLVNSLKKTLQMLEDSGAKATPWPPAGAAA